MLTPLAPNLWCATSDLHVGGVCFPGRMTVVRLPDGGVWLHSALPLTDALAASVESLGPVRHIVAPNAFHHLHAAAAKRRFPDATLHGTPALRKKKPDLRLDRTLDEAPPAGWAGVLDSCEIAGAPSLHEFVFFHVPSRTLIVTDLLFNMRTYDGLLSKAVFWMAGTYKRLGVSRLWVASTRDRAARAASVNRVLDWDFDRLVPAHGNVMDSDAHAPVAAVLDGMRRG
jgi:hypothetical protein